MAVCVCVRLEDLKQVHRRHLLDRDERVRELETLKAECVKIQTEGPTLADRFRFYQDLRGYVTDLVECLDEKVGAHIISGGSFIAFRSSDTHTHKLICTL